VIRVRNWQRHQHYGKSKPPWIKLYRDALGNYELMHRLEPAERWVVIGLWMLAAETDNHIPLDVAYLQHRLRAPVSSNLLRTLQTLGFIEVGEQSRESLEQVYAKTEERRGETETENILTALPIEIVENSEPRPSTSDTYAVEDGLTDYHLRQAANERLGLGRLSTVEQMDNSKLLGRWLYSDKRDRLEVMNAILGAASLRDSNGIGWENGEGKPTAGPGTPMRLAALNGTHSLYQQGDGTAVRTLWDIAVEHQRTAELTDMATTRGFQKGLRSIHIEGVA
jgi:hypothetical protein